MTENWLEMGGDEMKSLMFTPEVWEGKKRAIEEQIREALVKDFNALYVKEFTTDWEFQRIIRSTEIAVMDLSHVLKLLDPHHITAE